jgi:hypothetical protein
LSPTEPSEKYWGKLLLFITQERIIVGIVKESSPVSGSDALLEDAYDTSVLALNGITERVYVARRKLRRG